MKRRTILPVAMCLFMFIACKKDSKKDCDINNYGTVTVNFLHTSDAYWLQINGRIKVNPTGLTGDTLHCPPGSFNLQILNHTTSNSMTQSVNIQTCKDVAVNTSI